VTHELYLTEQMVDVRRHIPKW